MLKSMVMAPMSVWLARYFRWLSTVCGLLLSRRSEVPERLS